MGLDLCGWVRRDHDDLDKALAGMCDAATPPKELANLVEIFRLALAVHSATEAHVLDLMLTRVDGPRALSMIVTHTRVEHSAQCVAAERLLEIRPASLKWYEHATALRDLVLDHACRSDRARWTYQDHLKPDIYNALAIEYAHERMRVLANTSPLDLAQRRAHSHAGSPYQRIALRS
jgi:hypothetical protein